MKGLRFFRQLHTNELACHTFVDAYRIRKIPVSDTGDFLTQGTVSSISIIIILSVLLTLKYNRGYMDEPK